MASLLDDVVRHLDRNDVRAALIGAVALSVYGVARATFDADLLTVDRRVLTDEFWAPLRNRADVEVRRGDYDDPLAGVVRVHRAGDRQVDVVIPKQAFARAIVERAENAVVAGVNLRVVRLADLILLKLFAGGPQDRVDIESLLVSTGADVIGDVDAEISTLPKDARDLWSEIRARLNP